MLDNPPAIAYLQQDDPVLQRKVALLKAHATARFLAPWPLYDAQYWTYLAKLRRHNPGRERYRMIP